MRLLRIAILAAGFSCYLLSNAPHSLADGPLKPQSAKGLQHSLVYSHPKEFTGWPANGGSWSWDGGRKARVSAFYKMPRIAKRR